MTKPSRKKAAKAGTKKVSALRRQSTALAPAGKFDEVLALIEAARRRAYQAVNTELVGLYWELGEYISSKIASAEWGDGVVDELAATIAREYPGMRLHAPQPVPDAAVLRGLPRRRESVSAADTIAVDPPSPHPRPDEAARGTPVLHARGAQGAVDLARPGAPAPHAGLPPPGARPGEGVSGVGTNPSERHRGVQERLQPRVPGPARRPLGGGPPWRPPAQPRPLHHRARPRLLLRSRRRRRMARFGDLAPLGRHRLERLERLVDCGTRVVEETLSGVRERNAAGRPPEEE